jgi:hypothetical protein
VEPLVIIKYAITVVAERDTPDAQCTSTQPPFRTTSVMNATPLSKHSMMFAAG